ncbi:hypothetical protein MTR67_035862 [Solanum verrucosum]|uniref:Uncharacterized protein n=1 Tax=Solanum verrucosum TaxID=315347 RepID=A0AAF0UAN8_SOLVR|nr:hypothetical protein MTR67_035862 [Solanum verrucosum]
MVLECQSCPGCRLRA